MRARARARSLKSSLLHVLLPRLALFAVAAVALTLGHVIAPESPAAQVVAVDPAEESAVQGALWTLADAFRHPDCVPSRAWPAGAPAAFLVVHSPKRGEHVKMAFDRAWRVNHDDVASNDVWVIGICGDPAT